MKSLSLSLIFEARFCDSVVLADYQVSMCAFAGLMVPRRPLVAVLSYDERVLVWTLLIESGHIPLRVTWELQPRPLQTLATETTCLGATSCLSGPSPRLGASAGE